MKFSYYTCPDCGAGTRAMLLMAHKNYKPTPEELAARPNLEHIAHEVLRCSCGRNNNWFCLVKNEEGIEA